MTEHRIGTTLVHGNADALVVHCPALRNGLAASMLATFGVACSFIAMASFAGLMGHGDSAASSLLAFAFAGVFVLPLLGIGGLFIAIALWSAFNALTVATTAGNLRVERRWCGMLISRKTVPVDAIDALDCVREARFNGIFGGARFYRVVARTRNGPLSLADHLRGSDDTQEALQIFVTATGRADLANTGRRDHRTPADANSD